MLQIRNSGLRFPTADYDYDVELGEIMERILCNVEQKAKLKTSRRSNLELYRIVVMLLIVAHHFVVNSGLFQQLQAAPLSPRSSFFILFGAWGKTGIDCFVLITGYFMCQSRITLRKFLKLLLEIWFYKVLFYFIFLCSGYINFDWIEFVKAIIPIGGIHSNFATCFVLFYLFIPFINILIDHLDRRKHILLLSLSLFCYSFLSLLPGFGVTMNYVTWFVVLYFVASYIRLYGLFPNWKNLYWGLITLGLIIIGSLSVLALAALDLFPYGFLVDSNQPLALLIAVSSFMWFKDLKIRQSSVINYISVSCFGVLLIHANGDVMRQWLWYDIIDCLGLYYKDYAPFIAMAAVISIFCICVIIDRIRIETVEKWTFKWLDTQFINKIIKPCK